MFTNQELLQILQLQAFIFCNTKRAKQGLGMWDTIDEVETEIMLENRATKQLMPSPPEWIII